MKKEKDQLKCYTDIQTKMSWIFIHWNLDVDKRALSIKQFYIESCQLFNFINGIHVGSASLLVSIKETILYSFLDLYTISIQDVTHWLSTWHRPALMELRTHRDCDHSSVFDKTTNQSQSWVCWECDSQSESEYRAGPVLLAQLTCLLCLSILSTLTWKNLTWVLFCHSKCD